MLGDSIYAHLRAEDLRVGTEEGMLDNDYNYASQTAVWQLL